MAKTLRATSSVRPEFADRPICSLSSERRYSLIESAVAPEWSDVNTWNAYESYSSAASGVPETPIGSHSFRKTRFISSSSGIMNRASQGNVVVLLPRVFELLVPQLAQAHRH